MYEHVKLESSALPAGIPAGIAMFMLTRGKNVSNKGAHIECSSEIGMAVLHYALSYSEVCSEASMETEITVGEEFIVVRAWDQSLGVFMYPTGFEIISLGDIEDGIGKIVAILQDEKGREELVERLNDMGELTKLKESLDRRIHGLMALETKGGKGLASPLG